MSCPGCGLDFDRHGWVAAVWINTWVTILTVMGWAVAGFVVTFPDVPWTVGMVAVVLAVGVPVLGLPAAKLLQTGILLRWDPPRDGWQR